MSLSALWFFYLADGGAAQDVTGSGDTSLPALIAAGAGHASVFVPVPAAGGENRGYGRRRRYMGTAGRPVQVRQTGDGHVTLVSALVATGAGKTATVKRTGAGRIASSRLTARGIGETWLVDENEELQLIASIA
jgi:hypothetical protein